MVMHGHRHRVQHHSPTLQPGSLNMLPLLWPSTAPRQQCPLLQGLQQAGTAPAAQVWPPQLATNGFCAFFFLHASCWACWEHSKWWGGRSAGQRQTATLCACPPALRPQQELSSVQTAPRLTTSWHNQLAAAVLGPRPLPGGFMQLC